MGRNPAAVGRILVRAQELWVATATVAGLTPAGLRFGVEVRLGLCG